MDTGDRNTKGHTAKASRDGTTRAKEFAKKNEAWDSRVKQSITKIGDRRVPPNRPAQAQT